MNFIDQELIPNRQILSFGNWENMELEMFFLSVTRGKATSEQRELCYQRYISEVAEYEIELNNRFFESNNTFELWIDNKLIGLCQNTAVARNWIARANCLEQEPDIRNKRTLLLSCNLEAVFILKEHRGKELGEYFAGVIRGAQFTQLLGLLAHQNVCDINHVEINYYCDYENKGGENFHQWLYADAISEYTTNVLIKLGCSNNVTIDSGY